MRRIARLIAAGALAAMSLTGCASWFSGTDVAGKDPTCASECDRSYSACTGQGPTTTSPSMNPAVCSGTYADCVRRCPAK